MQNYKDLHKWNFMWSKARGLEFGGKHTEIQNVQQVLDGAVASINCSRGFRQTDGRRVPSSKRAISCFLKKRAQ